MTEEQRQKGLKAARYFGGEAEANNDTLSSYQDDMAHYFGYEKWKDLSDTIRADAMKEFQKGRDEEKACHGR